MACEFNSYNDAGNMKAWNLRTEFMNDYVYKKMSLDRQMKIISIMYKNTIAAPSFRDNTHIFNEIHFKKAVINFKRDMRKSLTEIKHKDKIRDLKLLKSNKKLTFK